MKKQSVAPWADEDLRSIAHRAVHRDDRRLGRLSRLVERLVRETDMDYGAIVARVREEFPDAMTTARSVASVACVMRSKGVAVPMRVRRREVQLALI